RARGAMNRHAIGADTQPGVQDGNVVVADERFRPAPPTHVVDVVEETCRTVPAAHAPQGVDGFVSGESVEVADALAVAAGEISVALANVLAQQRLPRHAADGRDRAIEIRLAAHRSGGRDQGDARTGRKEW